MKKLCINIKTVNFLAMVQRVLTILQINFAEASPKHILNMMQVKGLRISHIKSHLQVLI